MKHRTSIESNGKIVGFEESNLSMKHIDRVKIMSIIRRISSDCLGNAPGNILCLISAFDSENRGF